MEGGYQSLTRMMNNETNSIKFDTLEKMCDLFNFFQWFTSKFIWNDDNSAF